MKTNGFEYNRKSGVLTLKYVGLRDMEQELEDFEFNINVKDLSKDTQSELIKSLNRIKLANIRVNQERVHETSNVFLDHYIFDKEDI